MPQTRAASAKVTDKSRILEKPERFNPPSHGSRLPRKKRYPVRMPQLDDVEREAQDARRYPNSFPPQGTFMHWFLTNRAIHVWISLGVLISLAGYTFIADFLSTTDFRDQLPATGDLLKRPFATIYQFVQVYKLHVEEVSRKTADLRQRKLDDVDKRREYLRAQGVEPGFLTGNWMEKFGTVEGDEARRLAQEREANASTVQAEDSPLTAGAVEQMDKPVERQRRKKPKMWFGIWGGD
ncbi:MAG: hypothetical protein M1828_002733 [Chrysothrix sp. TS-e1954]|nr:MAG: hypothetical protein M1828_002733 [Chrysothrix sp. TS-e1954]